MKVPVLGRPHGGLRAAAPAGLLAVAGLAGASPALAAPVVEAVTIDCVGDSVVGHVGIQDPENGTATITLLGRTGTGPFVTLATTTVSTEPDMFEIAYSFTVTQHRTQYRVQADVGAGARSSQIIHDRTCQPPAEVPEAGVATTVPLAMGAAAGAAWWARRRRAAAR
jgi:hypothetical protein